MLDQAEAKTGELSQTIGYSSTGSVGGGIYGNLSLRHELHVINMYTMSMEKWSGNSTIAGIMNKVQQVEALIMRVYLLSIALNSLIAGPTAFGVLYAGANLLGLAMTASNMSQMG